MKPILPLLALVAASSAFAQTAPSVAKKPALQHSVEVSYIMSSLTDGMLPTDEVDDFSGYQLAAKVYVWQNVFLALEYVDTSADVNSTDPGAPSSLDISRFGYGLGATFQVGPGLISASYTLGEIDADEIGDVDQDRLNVTYTHAYANGLTASLGLTHFLNEGPEDHTAVILAVGYDFKNGLSVLASYSPNSADIGADELTENTFSLGAKYSF